MPKYFRINLRKNSISGPIVANSQVITVSNIGSGSILAENFVENSLSGNVSTDITRRGNFTRTISNYVGPVATYTISPANYTANEAESVTFTIATNNVSTGTNLYWLMDGLGPVDYVSNLGTQLYLSNATLGTSSNVYNGITGNEWAIVVNRLYLKYLGRYAENESILNYYAANLVAGSVTVDQVEATLASSQEVINQPPNPRGITAVAANGNAYIVGITTNDQRLEPLEASNLIIKTGSINGTEVARTPFSITNTDSGLLQFFGTPSDLFEGNSVNVSMFTIGYQFANTNVVVRFANVEDAGPNASVGSDVTINGGSAVNVFITTNNATITTFNINTPSDGIAEGIEWVLLRAFTENGALISSSGNIRIHSAT